MSIEDVLKALSDNKALVLFNTIALSDVDNNNITNQISIRKLGLTRRQYYSRLSRLTEIGLIRKQNGRYSLTLLGNMIYEIHISTSKILSYHWKLKAIDSIQMSVPGCARLPEEEFSKVVNTLIDDPKITNMVTRALSRIANSKMYPRQQKEERVQTLKVQSLMT